MSVREVRNEIDFQKKRLKEAGEETLDWLQSIKPGEFVRENPWLVVGIAAGLGFLVGQWSKRWSPPSGSESRHHDV